MDEQAKPGGEHKVEPPPVVATTIPAFPPPIVREVGLLLERAIALHAVQMDAARDLVTKAAWLIATATDEQIREAFLPEAAFVLNILADAGHEPAALMLNWLIDCTAAGPDQMRAGVIETFRWIASVDF